MTNMTLQNPFWCFIFWDIRILRLNIQKDRENGHNMHQNGHIWYFWAIFFCWNLSASIWARFMSNGCAYFTHLKKIVKISLAKNHQKLAILRGMLAIFPGFHLMIIWTHVLVTNRTLRNPLWYFIFWDIRILRLNILKHRENNHDMQQNGHGHIRYVIAIFVAETFQPLSERASSRMDVLISPIWKFFEGFYCPKITKNWKNGHSKCYAGHCLRFSPDDHLDQGVPIWGGGWGGDPPPPIKG